MAPGKDEDEAVVVYQVINHDREQIFYGTTSGQVADELEKIARDPGGPAKGWKFGDTVTWRTLSPPLKLVEALYLQRQFESGEPPMKFAVIRRLADEPQSS